jgi:hypothetical protein
VLKQNRYSAIEEAARKPPGLCQTPKGDLYMSAMDRGVIMPQKSK